MEPMLSTEIRARARRQADLCKVFSSFQRVLILWLLTDQERTVSEIAHALGASLPSTSQHLHLMEQFGILVSRREKQNIFYSLADTKLQAECLALSALPVQPPAPVTPPEIH